jgi:hypothetical protein
MPINIDKPKEDPVKVTQFSGPKKRKQRAAASASKRPTVTSDTNPNNILLDSVTSGSIAFNISMEENVTEFARSNTNPDFEAFETLVDEIRRAVRKTVDYRKSVNDDSPVSIAHYTNDTIKKGIRKSRWA